MQSHDPTRELQEAIAYLKKTTGQILTYQQYQRQEFERRWQTLDQQIRLLTQSAQSVSSSSVRLINEATKGIKDQAGESIVRGATPAIDSLDAMADRVVARLDEAAERHTQALEARVSTLERRIKTTTWVMFTAAAVMLSGSAWFAYSSRDTVKENARLRAETQYLDLVNRADWVPCGDQLCANVDSGGEGVGDKQQYLPVKPRQQK